MSPTIVIDSSFTDAELIGIAEGMDRWEHALPFHFTRVDMDHNDIPIKGKENTIYIKRAIGTNDPDCIVGDGRAATTYVWFDEASRTMCFDSDFLDGLGALEDKSLSLAFRHVTMHELGHALGINKGGVDGYGHMVGDTVMATFFLFDADEISAQDIETMKGIWGIK